MGGDFLFPCNFLPWEFNWRSLPCVSHPPIWSNVPTLHSYISCDVENIWRFSATLYSIFAAAEILALFCSRQLLQNKIYHNSTPTPPLSLSQRRLAEPFTPAPNLGRVISSHNALHPFHSSTLWTQAAFHSLLFSTLCSGLIPGYFDCTLCATAMRHYTVYTWHWTLYTGPASHQCTTVLALATAANHIFKSTIPDSLFFVQVAFQSTGSRARWKTIEPSHLQSFHPQGSTASGKQGTLSNSSFKQAAAAAAAVNSAMQQLTKRMSSRKHGLSGAPCICYI